MISSFLATAAAFHFASGTLYSATVFKFGPSNSYVTERSEYRATAQVTGEGPYISAVAFDDSRPLSPAQGYSGPVFYGGYAFTSSTTSKGFDVLGQGLIDNYSALSDGNDALYFNVTGTSAQFSGTEMSFASVFVFNQEVFEQPFREGNVNVDGFSIRLGKNSTGGTTSRFNPEGRWLVKIDDVYYLSNTTFSLSINLEATSFDLSGEALQSTLWAAYDPQGTLFFNAGGASFGELPLEQITAVGFYIADASFQSSGTVGMRLAVSEFSVTTAIPEPAPLALIAIPCLIGYFSLRLRKSLPQSALPKATRE